MEISMQNGNKDTLLLKKFNSRDSDAFADIYIFFYDRLFNYASKLYITTEVVASDKIHDIFLKLWENTDTKFTSLDHIKAYLYNSIKNSFIKHMSHNEHVDKFAKKMYSSDDYFVTEIIETETSAILSEFIEKLPEEYSSILTLYIQGWDLKDISKHLNIPQSTVYRQKDKAISLLSKKVPKDLMMLFASILN